MGSTHSVSIKSALDEGSHPRWFDEDGHELVTCPFADTAGERSEDSEEGDGLDARAEETRRWREADFSFAQLRLEEFVDSDLSGATLFAADLAYVAFDRANLKCADLSRADLSKATLVGANLSSAKFVGADCEFADFTEADLRGADFSGANVEGCQWRGAVADSNTTFPFDHSVAIDLGVEFVDDRKDGSMTRFGRFGERGDGE